MEVHLTLIIFKDFKTSIDNFATLKHEYLILFEVRCKQILEYC